MKTPLAILLMPGPMASLTLTPAAQQETTDTGRPPRSSLSKPFRYQVVRADSTISPSM